MVCCAIRSQIKSKANSFIKKKDRYAVPQGCQINLNWNSLIKFAIKEKEKERKKERKEERKRERKKNGTKKRKKENQMEKKKKKRKKKRKRFSFLLFSSV